MKKYVSVMQSDITVECTLKQQRFQSLLEQASDGHVVIEQVSDGDAVI